MMPLTVSDLILNIYYLIFVVRGFHTEMLTLNEKGIILSFYIYASLLFM